MFNDHYHLNGSVKHTIKLCLFSTNASLGFAFFGRTEVQFCVIMIPIHFYIEIFSIWIGISVALFATAKSSSAIDGERMLCSVLPDPAAMT